jgi:Toxin SymE, type I toxin-antitoxin system
MAKPDDTRNALVSANTRTSSNASSRIDNTSAGPTTTAPATTAISDHAALIPVLEALPAKLKAAKAGPVPPKHARHPRIKPRRRVTVSASVSPDTGANIPQIRLCGHWLVPAGFGLHTRVRVHVAKDCLILKPEDAG